MKGIAEKIAQIVPSFDMNSFMELYNEVLNHKDPAISHGDVNHDVQNNLSKMHHMITKDFIEDDKVYTGRMPRTSEDFEYRVGTKDADKVSVGEKGTIGE